jgi:GH25 family lysozyme M1 (1,4-beta-N-acetylmuramidase)
MVWVIDVSVHQGRIDWRAVKDAGVQGVWIKVGGADGGLYRDSRAGENIAGAEAVGLPYGTYYFCVPDADPRRQAQHALVCGHGRGQMWPAADIETNPHALGPGELDQWAADFCAEILRQLERESVIYTNLATVGRSPRAPSHCPLWIANYGGNRPGTSPPNFRPQLPPAWSDWDAWQFNDKTDIPGITANTVDQNVVTDAFWARMTGPSAKRIKELTMKGITGDHPNTRGFEQMLWPDGMGAFVRIGIPNGVPEKAGLIDGHVALEGAELEWFANLPAGNPFPANQSALQLTAAILTRLDVITTRLDALGSPTVDVDEDAIAARVTERVGAVLAKATADEIASRLES